MPGQLVSRSVEAGVCGGGGTPKTEDTVSSLEAWTDLETPRMAVQELVSCVSIAVKVAGSWPRRLPRDHSPEGFPHEKFDDFFVHLSLD